MLSSYQDLIEGLTETPGALRALLGDPVPADLDPAKVALLAELRAREQVHVRRVQGVMRDQTTPLRPLAGEPELAAPVAAPSGESPEALLGAFNSERSELIALLMNLTLRDWDHPIHHDEAGETSLGEEIDAHLSWDEAMLGRFRRTKDSPFGED